MLKLTCHLCGKEFKMRDREGVIMNVDYKSMRTTAVMSGWSFLEHSDNNNDFMITEKRFCEKCTDKVLTRLKALKNLVAFEEREK